ncbi:sigma-70 family RNA polymerase sigma factor [Rathayibacter sp. VKM Ac-2759]|uniref:sigma-70 family RNA polymerase sigma factor n=1 Tax=Rathayibacter sp. VKM Ac-2759 TaxID=2609252 RepID=UPI001315B485|nr:sigma-70 family RNA polymerase sigma factor [Rathayibacter sp. VKM Ac-2759]QHC67431.1 sigma-70 family RNA polymerase sigma factor [Rathayibacter sp. VKM Ac-2759]
MGRRAGSRGAVDPLGDAELIELVRRGEATATAELWRRHAAAARTVARAWSSSLDPDDLVSEAFLRVLSTIERGGGPEGAFRPYLFTAVRNVAASWGRRQDRERPLAAEEDVVAPGPGPEETVLAALDRDLGVRAFRALPARWQEVLWYTEVEGLSPAEAAPLLGLRPNSVAALSHRAREGLRGAWIQEHVTDVSAEGECRWVLERAGSHVRGRLPARDRLRVRSHLGECVGCRVALRDAEQSGARLATVLLPLVAGVGGSAAYAAGGAVPGVSGGGGAAVGGSAASAGSVAGGASAATVAVVAAGLVLVAGVAVAALLPIAGPETTRVPDASESAPESTPTEEETLAPVATVELTPSPAPDPSATAPSTEPSPTSGPDASAVPAPVLAPPSREPLQATPVPTTTPPAAPAPPPDPTPGPTPTATPGPTPTPTPPVTPTATPTPPVPATSTLETDPDERLLPGATGTAAPGAAVSVEDARSGLVYASTVAGTDGTWSLESLDLPVGDTAVTVRTTAPDGTETLSASETVRLRAPSVLAPSTASASSGVPVLVLSDPGAVQLLVDGEVALERTVSSAGFVATLDLAAGEHEIGVRYASADGRVGAVASTAVDVR